jgi:ABC-2 type transport system ATP-binding protein
MIEVSNLTKRYARHVAVDGISFTVQKGEILGFLGPNGAGKTTTMRILTGFLPASSGSAKVSGFDVFEQPLEVKRRVGYLPETPPLYPDLSVTSYLDFVSRIKGVPGSERKRRIDEAVEKCRVGDVRHKLIGKLSKGYRQRVGLAQAILHKPDVLVLDEPTAGLDPKQIIETRELIRSLGGEHTVVLSTHILPEVSVTCSRVVIINQGRVVAEDTPDALMHRLQGRTALKVEVRGEAAPAVAALEAVAGVTLVKPEAGATGITVLQVESEPGRDVRAELARAVVEKGLDLVGLSRSGMSLEDIFLHLTTQDLAEEGQGTVATPAAAAPSPGDAFSGDAGGGEAGS